MESLAYPAEAFILVGRNWQAFEDSKKRALEKCGGFFVFFLCVFLFCFFGRLTY